MQLAMFNRIYLEQDDVYVIEFPSPLEFYADEKKIWSNRYDIVIKKNYRKLDSKKFYKLVIKRVIKLLDKGLLTDVKIYSYDEWSDKHGN